MHTSITIRLAVAALAIYTPQAITAEQDFWAQMFADQHSVEALNGALQAAIPQEYILQAQQFDDALLSKNDFDGTKAYPVTDEQLEKVEGLTARLLSAMGENADEWVVRLLDTDPPIQNAFVTGGKYIYVFTGLSATAKSDDELAFVLGHEIGHSLLKHAYRRSQSWQGKAAAIAEAMASQSKTASGMSAALSAGYGRDDEREADALATVIARKAGFNAMRGADFFSRTLRGQDRAKAAREEQLITMRSEAVNALAACKQFRERYQDCSGIEHVLTDCAKKMEQICSDANDKADTFNKNNARTNQDNSDQSLSEMVSTHPPDQERIASIAALSDFLKGKRRLDSLTNYPQAQRVMSALTQVSSPLLKADSPKAADSIKGGKGNPQAKDGQDVEAKLEKLNSLRSQGLITKEEYEKKRKDILDSM